MTQFFLLVEFNSSSTYYACQVNSLYLTNAVAKREPEKKNSGSLGLEPWPLQSVLQSEQNKIDIFDTQ